MSPQYPFEVFVSKEDFKFNASHFVAYRNYRERIHGHNYKVSVRLIGERIQEDGYLLDFGDVKRAVRKLCKEMNEHFICPMLSDVIEYIPKSSGSSSSHTRASAERCQSFQVGCASCSGVSFLP
jgi:6-pyruvoyl-tetrahydropterin synthase